MPPIKTCLAEVWVIKTIQKEKNIKNTWTLWTYSTEY